jgi:PAS domain S-box-containing protein
MGKKRAVIVEDEALIAGSIENKLGGMGFEVEKKFHSGRDAFRYIENAAVLPDLLLMDILLKDGEDGIEIASAIRAKTNVPVIFLSALNDQETIRRAASCAKPYHYLVKPFSEAELRTTVEIVMQRADLEHKLRESETRYRIISELSSDFAYSFLLYPNEEVEVEWVTGAAERITGYSVSEITAGIDYTLLFPPEDRGRLKRFRSTVLRGEPASLEHRLIRKDGSTRWIRNKAKPEGENRRGGVKRIFGAVEDITELKRIEEVERSKEQNFQALIKRMNDGVVVLDKTGIITFVNDLICSMTGYEKYELIGKHVHTLDVNAGHKIGADSLPEVPYETTCRTKPGGSVNVLVSPKILHDGKGDFAGSFSVVTNIDKQKEKEYFLRREREFSKARYNNIFENTSVGLIEADLAEVEGLLKEKAARVKDMRNYLRRYPAFVEKLISSVRFKNVNRAALELLKVDTIAEYDGRLLDFMHPETIAFFRDVLIELLLGKRQIKREVPMYAADGSLLYILADFSLPRNRDGITSGVFSLIDVTDQHLRRKREEYLERKFHALFEQVPFGIALFDKNGGIRGMNTVFRKTWGIGRKKEKTLYREYSIFSDPQPFLRKNMKLVKRAFAGEVVQLPPLEYTPKRADKNSFGGLEGFWFQGYFFPIDSGDAGAGEIGFIVEDITEMKQAEEEIRAHERMYKLIVDFSPEAITFSDENRNIRYVSQKTLEVFRYFSKEEIIGKSILAWISGNDQQKAIENIKDVYAGFSKANTYTLVRADNSSFTAEITSAAISDAAGKCRNMISIIREKAGPL